MTPPERISFQILTVSFVITTLLLAWGQSKLDGRVGRLEAPKPPVGITVPFTSGPPQDAGPVAAGDVIASARYDRWPEPHSIGALESIVRRALEKAHLGDVEVLCTANAAMLGNSVVVGWEPGGGKWFYQRTDYNLGIRTGYGAQARDMAISRAVRIVAGLREQARINRHIRRVMGKLAP